MRGFLGFLLAVIKVYIACKVMYILYMVNMYPNEGYFNELIWWSGFLIFDMWINGMLPPFNTKDDKNNDDSHLEDFRK